MTNSINYNSNGIGQSNFHGAQPMNPVRSTKQVVSHIHAIVGGALFGAGVLVFALHLLFDYHAAVLALQITGGALAFSGVVELIIAACFRRPAQREQDNLERLKAEGLSFPAETTKIQHHAWIQLGRSHSAHAECTYRNKEGKTYLVKSPSFLHKNKYFHMLRHGAVTPDYDNYSAMVYVNPHNPRDYAVEIFTQTSEAQGVYDYR